MTDTELAAQNIEHMKEAIRQLSEMIRAQDAELRELRREVDSLRARR